MNEESIPLVRTQMLIRRPALTVYEAFVDPGVTTRFWFSRADGRLEEGRTVRWDWEMFGVGTDVHVRRLEPGRRISIEWDDPPTPVEWEFQPRGDDATLVTITASGFSGSTAEITAQALDSMSGFTLVLAGLKAWLEHGIELGLVRDHFPDAATPGD